MNNKLTLSDIAALLAVRTGRDKRSAEQFLRELIYVVTDGLFTDKIVKIKGIGTFKIVQVEQRESVHVNTGERFIIPAHYKYSFLPDKELRDTVNAPFSFFETTEIGNDVDFSDLEESEEEDLATEEESVEEVIPEAEIPVGSRVEGVLFEAAKEWQEEPQPQPAEPEMPELPEVPAETEIQTEPEVPLPVISAPLELEEEKEAVSVPVVPEEELPVAEPEPEKLIEEPMETPVLEKNEPEPEDPDPEIIGNFEPVYKVPFYRRDSFLAILILLGFIGLSTLLYVWYSNRSIELVQVPPVSQVASTDSVKDFRSEPPVIAETQVEESALSASVQEPSLPEKEPEKKAEKEPEKKQVESAEQTPQWVDKVTISSGDRLTLISLKYYGHKFFWVYIYEANKDVIKNPNNVPIGTVLKIPAPGRYGIDPKSRASISKAAALQTKILQGED